MPQVRPGIALSAGPALAIRVDRALVELEFGVAYLNASLPREQLPGQRPKTNDQRRLSAHANGKPGMALASVCCGRLRIRRSRASQEDGPPRPTHGYCRALTSRRHSLLSGPRSRAFARFASSPLSRDRSHPRSSPIAFRRASGHALRFRVPGHSLRFAWGGHSRTCRRPVARPPPAVRASQLPSPAVRIASCAVRRRWSADASSFVLRATASPFLIIAIAHPHPPNQRKCLDQNTAATNTTVDTTVRLATLQTKHTSAALAALQDCFAFWGSGFGVGFHG